MLPLALFSGPGRDLTEAYLKSVRPAFLLAALALAVIVLGLLLGGFGSVLTNGRVICLDCIGIF